MRPPGRSEVEAFARRQFLLGALGAFVSACSTSTGRARAVAVHDDATFAEIEQRIGGRVGVFAIDSGTGRHLSHRADERFAMCSTFKWVLAASVLARVERAELLLDERLAYAERDLLDHSPITGAHVGEGSMSIDALAHAAVTVSDNAAANLLLAKTDGPAGLTRFCRSLGDDVTRLDRNEPALNDNSPGDPRDTTSPRAMVGLMRALLLSDALSVGNRERLRGWLRACDTGKDRLRAGLPATWNAGDKTGTGRRGAVNDIAIAWPPGRSPILIAAYSSDGTADLGVMARAHAEIGRVVAQQL